MISKQKSDKLDVECNPSLNLACVDMILSNIEAKHNREPMSWTKDARNKRNLLNRNVAYTSVPENREYVHREKSSEQKIMMNTFNKTKNRVERMSYTPEKRHFVNKLKGTALKI